MDAAQAMEESGNVMVEEKLAAGKKVHWHHYKKDQYWIFVAGAYRIVNWRTSDGIAQYAAFAGIDLLRDTQGTLEAARRLVSDHARLVVARRKNAEAAKGGHDARD